MKKLTDSIANLTLVNKVFLIVAMLGTLALIITFYSVNRLSSVDGAYRHLLTNDVDAAILMSEAQADLHEASRTVYAVLTEHQAQTMRAAQHDLDALQRNFVAKIEEALALMPHEYIRLQTIWHSQAAAFSVGADVIEAAARWRGDRALNIIHEELDPQFERLGEVLNAVQRDTVDRYLKLSSELGRQTQQTILTTASAIILALLLVLGLAALLSIHVISRPIMTLTKVMRSLSDHQYRQPIPYTHRRDEVGQMANALRVFREDMRRSAALERTSRENENARILAERTAEAKSAFLATMSHEIRTPMNAVIVLTRLILKQQQDPTQRHRLERILGASEHLLHILNDILDFSKIDAGQMVIEATEFHPNVLLQTVDSMLSESALQKGLSLKLHGLPETSGWLRADAFRISQILLNYTSNAIKFSEQGNIDIRLTLSQQGQTTYLRGEVRDQGIGMNEDQLKALFQPFQQADASIARRYGGTGLGLAICRSLTELMGGQVGATNAPDAGSIFWFSIPVERVAAGQHQPQNTYLNQAPKQESLLRSTSLRLLLVDDNALNREVGKELLELLGTQVELAVDGPHAIQILQNHPVDHFNAVLMDIMMPQMDGLQTTRLIRDMPEFSRLPVIALSANASLQDIAQCQAAGMNAHVAKPIDEQLLWDALTACLDSISPHLSTRQSGYSDTMSQTPITNACIFQPERLQALAASMQHADLDRLIDLIHADLNELGQTLLRTDLSRHPDLLIQLAHDLISLSGHAGMVRTNQVTEQLRQTLAGTTSPDEVTNALEQVQREFAVARQAFLHWDQNRIDAVT